jgi:hypothetical protein
VANRDGDGIAATGERLDRFEVLSLSHLRWKICGSAGKARCYGGIAQFTP